jgi:hypothetical protein
MQVVTSAAMRGARMGKVVAFQGETGNAKIAKVKFCVKQKLHFGQHLAVVGSNPALGEWNPANSLELRWTAEDVWVAEAELSLKDNVDFKFVIVESEDQVKWPAGDNIALAVPEDAAEVLVEAEAFDTSKIVIKTEAKVQTKVAEKIPEKKEKTIPSVATADVGRVGNIMRKATTPITATSAAAAASTTTKTAAAAPSSISSAATPLSLEQIEKLTMPKIKEIMVKMGLETTGKKADLIARIRAHLQT